MIQLIYKGSDIELKLNIKDKSGNTIRIQDLDMYEITIFTAFTRGDNIAFSCSGKWDKLKDELLNIIITEDSDILLLKSFDLSSLDEGLIHYQYHIKILNPSFPSGYIDEVVEGETTFYLKDKRI